MSETSEKYKKFSLIFLIIFFILQVLWSFYLIPKFKTYSGTSQTIDATINYDYESIMELLINYKISGIKFYNYLQIFDIFYSLTYFLFFIFTFKFLFAYLEEKFLFYISKIIYIIISIIIPTLSYIFDSLENIFIFIIRINFPYISKSIVAFSNISTLLKFLFFSISTLSIILIIIKIFYLYIKKLKIKEK
ncbi:MAG: hypothetical protein N3A58_04415 [Spirochaetes bacterium]|nr:hypothetical protein [Spirochaetota bacterium]